MFWDHKPLVYMGAKLDVKVNAVGPGSVISGGRLFCCAPVFPVQAQLCWVGMRARMSLQLPPAGHWQGECIHLASIAAVWWNLKPSDYTSFSVTAVVTGPLSPWVFRWAAGFICLKSKSSFPSSCLWLHLDLINTTPSDYSLPCWRTVPCQSSNPLFALWYHVDASSSFSFYFKS